MGYALLVFGFINLALAALAPSVLRGYPGSAQSKRALGLAAGAILIVIGSVVVATGS